MIVIVKDPITKTYLKIYTDVISVVAIETEKGKLATITHGATQEKGIEDLTRYDLIIT